MDGIYFVKDGEAGFVNQGLKSDLIFATSKTGSHFGDVDFISGGLKRAFTVKAKTDLDLLMLEKDDLYSLD